MQIGIEQKQFAGLDVIVDFKLSVTPGEFVALVGPSGCGKTTLLNLVAGLDKDFTGTISNTCERIGYMFQAPRLMPWLNLQQNIELVTGDEHCEIPALLSQFDLAGNENLYPAQLSGGMRRRASMARAFAIQPDLMLLDEPFLSLDQPTAERLRLLLLDQWQRSQCAVLFVSHDLAESISLADRILFLGQKPMSVLLDYHVKIPRPRHLNRTAVEALTGELLISYPGLLSGIINHDSL